MEKGKTWREYRENGKWVEVHTIPDNGSDVIDIPEGASHYRIQNHRIKFYNHNTVIGCRQIDEKYRSVEITSERHQHTVVRQKKWNL